MYKRLEEFYHTLSPSELKFFKSYTVQLCPFKGVKATKPIIFFKFFDNYLCFHRHQRNIMNVSKLSPLMLEHVNLVGTEARKYKGAEGAWASEEIVPILRHLGFSNFALTPPQSRTYRPDFIVYRKQWPHFVPTGYTLTMCSFVISNMRGNETHAIAGILQGSKRYVMDPNFLKLIPCNWTDISDILRVIPKITKQYTNVGNSVMFNVNWFQMEHAIATNDAVVDSIHPKCAVKPNVTRSILRVKRPRPNSPNTVSPRRVSTRIYPR